MKAKEITQEQFHDELIKILSTYTAAHLLDIAGIYEIVSEEFNNEVINNILNNSENE